MVSGLVFQIRVVLLQTGAAEPMAETNVGVPRDIGVDTMPNVVLVPDALAMHADRKEPLKLLDLFQRLLQLIDFRFESGL
jgi:hypothetical protein